MPPYLKNILHFYRRNDLFQSFTQILTFSPSFYVHRPFFRSKVLMTFLQSLVVGREFYFFYVVYHDFYLSAAPFWTVQPPLKVAARNESPPPPPTVRHCLQLFCWGHLLDFCGSDGNKTNGPIQMVTVCPIAVACDCYLMRLLIE